MKKNFIYILLLFSFSSISYGKCYTEPPHPYDSNAGSVASPSVVRSALEKKYPELKCQYCNDYRRSGYYGGGRYGVTARCNSTSYHLTASDLGNSCNCSCADGGGSGAGYAETMLNSTVGQGNYIDGISNADLGGIGGSGLSSEASHINIDIVNSAPTNLGEIGDGQMQAVLDMINKTNAIFGISTNGGGNGGDLGNGGGIPSSINDVCKSNNTFIILLRIIAKNSNGKIKDPCNIYN